MTLPRLPRVLLTGFDAFGAMLGDAINPSWLAVQALHGEEIAGHEIFAALLPTVFGQASSEMGRLLALHCPALVLGVGLAGGRSAISLERVAINLDDARIPDNAGAQPVDAPVVPGGPAAYFTTLPIKAMLAALQQASIPAEVSQSAGTYVCNHVFYDLMHRLASAAPPERARAGFVHVPYLPSQGSPSMPLPQTIAGLRILVECALRTREDLQMAAGSLS